MTHSLYVRRHSMNNYALIVLCSACSDAEFYKEVAYADNNQTEQESGIDDFGVPLSVLMDIAEEHHNEVDAR